jgi:NAD(P)-dependent dehydrogenase (short-subunit alcohol dehydrogenase family)
MRPADQQTILITGATAGLGKGLAHALADRGATVLVHGRSRPRVVAAISEITQRTGSERLVPVVADLSSLAAVRNLSEQVAANHQRLAALLNNAGIAVHERRESDDGYELTFAVNYLAPFLLTHLLLPVLRRSGPARVVNVASIGQAPVNFEDVMLTHGYQTMRAYSQSKLALISFTFELAERLRAKGEVGVTVTTLHPGTLMPTKLVLDTFGRTVDSLEQGVEATLRLVLDPQLDGVSGEYFDGLERAAADPQAYDKDARVRLWELSERLCGLH